MKKNNKTYKDKADKKVILVSNDDGVYAPGIKALQKELKKNPDWEVITVAPLTEQSGASHALTLHQPLRIEKIGKDIYGVSGTPTDSVTLALNFILKKKPDLVISGINRGGNIGEDVHYSGTVAAAMEGAIMGVSSIAVSCIGKPPFHFETSADFSVALVKKVLDEGLPYGVVLNVNVPNIPKKEIAGFSYSRLGKRSYGDVIVEKIDPRGRPYYWITGDYFNFEKSNGTDCQAYLQKKISITPIRLDMTDQLFLRKLKKWKLP